MCEAGLALGGEAGAEASTCSGARTVGCRAVQGGGGLSPPGRRAAVSLAVEGGLLAGRLLVVGAQASTPLPGVGERCVTAGR